jgi:hypothetical protein
LRRFRFCGGAFGFCGFGRGLPVKYSNAAPESCAMV